MTKQTYSDKLRDPRWQKKRLEILERDAWACQSCEDTSSTLHVHHRYYKKGLDPWDYDNQILITLCTKCHDLEHFESKDLDNALLATIKRHFLSEDILRLATSFRYMTKPADNDVSIMVDVISKFLQDDEFREEMINAYRNSMNISSGAEND